MKFQDLFSSSKLLLGMVHLLALPGSPNYAGDMDRVVARARKDAQSLIEAGFDGIIVENFNDEPYLLGEVRLETTIAITKVITDLRLLSSIPIGLNIQFNAWNEEISIANVAGANFIRVEGFVDVSLSSWGMIEPCAGLLLRRRGELGLRDIFILSDIHTKYTTPKYPLDIETSAKMAYEAGSDGIIVTGSATGVDTPLQRIRAVKQTVDLPVIVGSGVKPETIRDVMNISDGVIVGTSIKYDQDVHNEVSVEKATELVAIGRGE